MAGGKIELPSDQPLVIAAGTAVALWGVTLLASSLPSFMSIGSPTRSMRLASVGIRIAAALVGLVSGSNPTYVGVLVSLGMLFGMSLEFVLGTLLRQQSRRHVYSELSAEDEDGEESIENKESVRNREDESSSPSGLTASLAVPPPDPSPEHPPIVHGLAIVSSAFYFSLVKGLQLGSDLFVIGGFELDTDIACVVGQVALLGVGTSIALQDVKGLSVEASALVLLIFAFGAPIGLVTGALLATTYDERTRGQAALDHHADPVRGHGPPVTIDPHLQLQRGSIGLGYRLGPFSTVVCGIILYQTLAAAIPRERRDADAEWAHKYASHISNSPQTLVGQGGWSSMDIKYAKTQCFRLGSLVFGWTAMALLHWPITPSAGSE